MTNDGLIAARYAQALSNAVGDSATLAAVRDQARALARVVSTSEELRRAIKSPVVSPDAKERVMRGLAEKLGGRKETIALIHALAAGEQLALLGDVVQALDDLLAQRAGLHQAEVRSATPLDDATRARLTAALQKIAGGTVQLQEKIEPGLLGGVVAQLGGKVYDGSLRTKLAQMRARLN